VRFLGQRSDVDGILAAADLYCQPNQGPEPFGLSIVEALAAGLPVVATRLGAFPEIVTEACGVLVDPDSPSAVATTLDDMLGDATRRRAMAEAARRRAAMFCNLHDSLHRLARTLASSGVSAPALSVP
jgi:glycosyltransferase involved in cell wall biosynthesis